MSWLPKGKLTGDPLNDFMYIECLQVLSEDFLIRNDKLGMAFSMEARFPMMCNVFKVILPIHIRICLNHPFQHSNQIHTDHVLLNSVRLK